MLTIVTAERAGPVWGDAAAKLAPRPRTAGDTAERSAPRGNVPDRLGPARGIGLAVVGAAVFWACVWYLAAAVF